MLVVVSVIVVDVDDPDVVVAVVADPLVVDDDPAAVVVVERATVESVGPPSVPNESTENSPTLTPTRASATVNPMRNGLRRLPGMWSECMPGPGKPD